MALISARTILTSISLFHLTLAFFFLTNPGTIADQAIVYVIGEAMGMVSFGPLVSGCCRRYVYGSLGYGDVVAAECRWKGVGLGIGTSGQRRSFGRTGFR